VGAYDSSVYGITPEREVGVVYPTSSSGFAAMWSGTAASMVNLGPSGATSSSLRAAIGNYQVGGAVFELNRHAGLWSGTAASFVDLHTSLGLGFKGSEALGISASGNALLISGTAHDDEGYVHAVLWTITVPEPSSLTLLTLGLICGSYLRRWRARCAVTVTSAMKLTKQ
jgi:hypothetical protein